MQITHINLAKGFRGGERQTQILIEQLSYKDYKQKLILRKGSKLLKRCSHIKNLTIIEIKKPYFLNIKHFKGSQILHAHETKALQLAYIVSKVLNIPYIVTRRVDNKIKSNFINKKLYKDASFAVSLSKAIKQTIKDISHDVNHKIIPSAFTEINTDENKIKEIKKRFKTKFLIGHVGALDNKHKGQSFLIDVAKELEDKYENLHFIFVGDGQDKEMLQKQASKLKNVTFEGFVDNVHDYISAFDMFVFPSLNEGLGSILFDVMKLEKPIIASSVGGIVDILKDKQNATLVQPANKKELKEAILKLYNDEKTKEFYIKNNLINIQNYSPSSMRDKYIKLYNKIGEEK